MQIAFLSTCTKEEISQRDWLLRMNQNLQKTKLGALNPTAVSSVMNRWAKTNSTEGAEMVDVWLQRLKMEVNVGNIRVKIVNETYNVAIDAWTNR